MSDTPIGKHGPYGSHTNLDGSPASRTPSPAQDGAEGELLALAEEWKGRADDAGRLSRGITALLTTLAERTAEVGHLKEVCRQQQETNASLAAKLAEAREYLAEEQEISRTRGAALAEATARAERAEAERDEYKALSIKLGHYATAHLDKHTRVLTGSLMISQELAELARMDAIAESCYELARKFHAALASPENPTGDRT